MLAGSFNFNYFPLEIAQKTMIYDLAGFLVRNNGALDEFSFPPIMEFLRI